MNLGGGIKMFCKGINNISRYRIMSNRKIDQCAEKGIEPIDGFDIPKKSKTFSMVSPDVMIDQSESI